MSSLFLGARPCAIVPVMSGSFNNPTPQFGTAEYVGSPGGDHCQFCHQPIATSYFRVNAAMTCPSCAEKVRMDLGLDTAGAFARSLLFGFGAAVLGLILYATFMIVTGISLGYATLAVGWMVGKAMMKGSNGRGGRRYQIAAALLTYVASTLARIPVWIHYRPALSGFIGTLIRAHSFSRSAGSPITPSAGSSGW
ncbi:MAG: hypothetical protein WCA49_20095 [Candidatus Sulfotelmatobacter sp.]